MDRAKLEALEKLLAMATPGPWQAKDPYLWDEIIGDIDGPDDGQYHCTDVAQAYGRADAALMVAAVNALPALLRLARVAREDAARLEALENKINEDGGLVLHNGNFTGNYAGLGLRNTSRTLRQAIDEMAGFDTLRADAADTTAGEGNA